jgi:hypothetical protein
MFPFPDDPWNPRYTQAAVTDESGTCSLELPGPGDYQMLVWSESRSLFHRFALVPEVVQHEIEVDLPTSGIRGTVHHVDKTWFGFTVRAARLGDDDVTHRNASDTTKNDGLFEIDWLPAGRYLVTAGVVTVERTHAPLGIGRAAFQEVELEEGEVLELHFEIERGVVEGEVVDLSGEPLGRADILIVHPSGVLLGTGVADKDGKFSVNAPTGRVAIAARTSKLASSRWTMLDLPADASRSVRLELGPSTVVELTAVDATGSEVSAWIRVFDGNGMDRSDERPDTESRRVDLRGPFPPGTYTIRAVAPDGRRAERVVEFDGRGYVHVEVTLP